MRFIDRICYSQNWNIGFCNQYMEDLVLSKKLSKIQWMKHPYKDRWFADPFIYKVTDDVIIVFVEEFPIHRQKGILCELHLDKNTKRLIQRYVLLELDTHLSYPAIIEYDNKTYVYPENGESGELNIYEYDSANHRLVNPICILNEAVADSTIIYDKGFYWLICTKYPSTQEGAYLYKSESLFGQFVLCAESCVQSDICCSRPAGNWFSAFGRLYRPAQNCKSRYGSALTVMSINDLSPYVEQEGFQLQPNSWSYNLGLHTINSLRDELVIDGYGYLYPFWGRIITFLREKRRTLLMKTLKKSNKHA